MADIFCFVEDTMDPNSEESGDSSESSDMSQSTSVSVDSPTTSSSLSPDSPPSNTIKILPEIIADYFVEDTNSSSDTMNDNLVIDENRISTNDDSTPSTTSEDNPTKEHTIDTSNLGNNNNNELDSSDDSADEGIEESKENLPPLPADDDNSYADEDTSSGFCSSSGGVLGTFDNLSGYDSIGGGGGQVDVGGFNGLVLEGSGLMLEDDDFGDSSDDMEWETPVARLLRRSQLMNAKSRENVCVCIPTTLHQVMDCPDDVETIMDIFHKLSQDQNQSVRIELIEQIPQLAVLCREYPQQLGAVMTEHLLPLTLNYVSNQICQLRKTTQAALLVVLEQRLLAPAEVSRVCQVVTDLTLPRVGATEEDRSEGLALMSRMAPILGKDLTKHFFLDRFTTLCLDSMCQIRKICAANFGEFTSIVMQDVTERVLLPLFVTLCKDNVWEVRKACAESFTEVSRYCLSSTKHTSLAPLFVSLLQDPSRWVRVSAFQHLGPFISTYAKEEAINRRRLNLDLEEQERKYKISGEYSASEEVSCSTPTPSSYSTPSHFPGELKEPHSPKLLTENTRSEPTDSPLPAVNLLDPNSENGNANEEYNSFNYWRMPLPDIDVELQSLDLNECVVEEQEKEGEEELKEEEEAKEEVTTVRRRRDEDNCELNTSTDSTDSEDIILELNNLSSGLLGNDTTMTKSPWDEPGWGYSDVPRPGFPTKEVLSSQEISSCSKSQNVVPASLVELFLQMADPRRSETEEKDIARHCAFAMPAVALTLGKENWPALRDTYNILSCNFQWRVRRTIAYSMHEVAAIIGGEFTAKDLVPIFKEFAVNETDNVRIGVLENMASFIRALSPCERIALLPHLKYFFGINDRRHREEFGKQLMQVIDFYRPADCDQFLKMYCLILLTDNVVFNRQNCYSLVSKLIQRLGSEGDESYIHGICDSICKRFAQHESWKHRQTFVFLCGRIFADNVMSLSLFVELLLPSIIALADDKVPNVRLVVAKVITDHLIYAPCFDNTLGFASESLRDTYSRLQRDKDRDVRYFANSPLSQGIDFLKCSSDMLDLDVEPLPQYPIVNEY